MLPYFEYTEDVHNFCMLMGFTTEITDHQPNGYVCMYSFEYYRKPLIIPYNLDLAINPLIPPDKALTYLTLMLNGYSDENAVNEIGVLG